MLRKLDEQVAGEPAASIGDSRSPMIALHRRRHSVLEALMAIAQHDAALAHEIAVGTLNRMDDERAASPFELAFVGKKIRDQRSSKELTDE